MYLEHYHLVKTNSNVFKNELIIGTKFIYFSLSQEGDIIRVITDGNIQIAVGHSSSEK